MLLSLASHAQPNGYEYVIQTDFGDAQDTIYPYATGQWVQTPWWKNVQQIGVQTNWYGPHYMPLGASSHGKYVMLDDDQYDYGAIAGNIHDLEYRLVQCDFDYHLYDPTTTSGFLDGGTLYVLLTESDVDVRNFDADRPEDFEANGYGQVLFELDIPRGSPTSITDPWYKLSGQNSQSTAYRTAYALSKSATGTPGSPFTYVGLVWRSRDPFAERILIDDFHLVDVCPDCVFRRPLIPDRGCFENTWVSPIQNNYYFYTAEIADSTTGDMVYHVVHQPARFSWDGIGNVGSWNGIQVPYDRSLTASITYYSCLRSQNNVGKISYSLTRELGCVDVAFGGNKTSWEQTGLKLSPNPVKENSGVFVRIPSYIGEHAVIRIVTSDGREVMRVGATLSIRSTMGQEIKLPALNSGIYFVEVRSNTFYEAMKLCIQN